ncbi:MOSC domain-containing protein [Litorihabitans aurantiacus]|uniref:MOSC domain-containing protein n=1 Tax=Litorihabitans aurantiacus TaxID=1930061 RepID=A0AA37XGS8_9MICO|nr:MOSC domain-containing protein [Litorihabitans aurantiacus]GMA32928.1 hypothetical protein GCM10025875_29200 [Litorihabitans aurantiacus]
MPSPRIVAVCTVHALVEDPGTIGVTAIDKRPVTGAVKVGPYGVRADVQADRKHHGGLDKALYAYAQEDAEHWAAELGREVPPGFFGENLRTEGIDVNDARIGEIWRIGGGEGGDATGPGGEGVEVQVTMPRTPCATFARWIGGEHQRGWVRRFSDARRLGPYLRVLRGGRITAGDPITVIERPDGPSIVDAYRAPATARA